MPEKRHDPRRIVKEVIVRYREYGESTDKPLREFRVSHKGNGAEINAITWSKTMLDKMQYLEDDVLTKAPVGKGGNDWETNLKEKPGPSTLKARGPINNHCVWLHDEYCNWWSYCGTET